MPSILCGFMRRFGASILVLFMGAGLLSAATAPTVTTAVVDPLTLIGGGDVTDGGGSPILERGVCYDSATNPPTTANSKVVVGPLVIGSFTCQIPTVPAGVLYYVRAYARNALGTSYGAVVTFTRTLTYSIPTVTTTAVDLSTTTAAGYLIGGGNVMADGGSTVTARGVCWNMDPTNPPITTDPHTSDGTGTGAFSSQLFGQTFGNTYYVRAYATNLVGTAYGDIKQFTPTFPNVTTTAVDTSTLIGGGNATFAGGLQITTRGLYWGTTTNPTAANSTILAGSGTGVFTGQFAGVTAGTTYYVRAFATNAAGTTYGNEVSFVALAPVVTTTAVNTATLMGGGNVTSDSGQVVSAYGICWSTNPNPTTGGGSIHTNDGSGTGAFTSQITGVTAGTTYYVRAYATNFAGTGYGPQVSFVALAPTVTTAVVNTANLMGGGNVTSDSGQVVMAYGLCWSTNPGPTISDTTTTEGAGTGAFTSQITGVTAGTTYYVRAYAINAGGTGYGNEVTFVALAPIVTTTAVDTATLLSGGNVTSDSGQTVTARGLCWSTNPAPVIGGAHTTNGAGTGVFTSQITGVTAGTTYYVRAYATNAGGTGYGNEVTFVALAPIVTTAVVNTATLMGGGNVTSDSGQAVTAYGLCWSTNHAPVIGGAHTTDGAGTGAFTSQITGVTAGTTYYVRAYATNAGGTGYGNEVTFVALAPIVTTAVVNTATLMGGGNVTSDSGQAVTAYGLCWSTNHAPVIGGAHTTDGAGTGAFTSQITGVTAGTTYYVRAYATNAGGTGYGNEVTFVALAPIVTTVAVDTATLLSGGNVTSDSGQVVTAYGLCWSTNPAPVVAGPHTTDGAGLGAFTSQIAGVTAGTTYYVRAYATNAGGTGYGNQVTFVALAPTVTTVAVDTATLLSGGTVTSDSGQAVTAYGVCWSTTPAPVVTGAHTTDGMGLGAFTSQIAGVTIGTTYYVRAYATNAGGTGYGNQVTFVPLAPTVTTAAVDSVAMAGGGSVTADGGQAVTARGICWDTNPSPLITGNHTTNGAGLGAFASQMINLTPGMTYYVRAYATTAGGTGYGNQVSFVPAWAMVTTGAIDQAILIGGGTVTFDGGQTVTARGVCWSTNPNPTTADSKTSNGIGVGSFVSEVSQVSQGVTYHLRAYATNVAGTVYGADVTFVPAYGIPTVVTLAVDVPTLVGGGTVTLDGGQPITARGICWSTSVNPTTADQTTSNGTGTGAFTSQVTQVLRNTLYHVRAYARNSVGTAYGSDLTFTPTAGIPIVTTTAINPSSLVGGGTVTDDGGQAVTARGICWSSSPNPTIADSRTANGAGTGFFTSQFSPAQLGVTYYIRAYAVNATGTGYGAQLSMLAPGTWVAITPVEGCEVAAAPGTGIPAFGAIAAKLRVLRYESTSIQKTAGTTDVQFSLGGSATPMADYAVTAYSYPGDVVVAVDPIDIASYQATIPDGQLGLTIVLTPLVVLPNDRFIETSLLPNAYLALAAHPAVTTPIAHWVQGSYDQVSVAATIQNAVEPDVNNNGGVSGQFTVSRTGTTGMVTAYLIIDAIYAVPTAAYLTDYVVSGSGVTAPFQPDAVDYPAFYDVIPVTIQDGTSSVVVSVDPRNNGVVKGRTAVTLRALAVPGRYNANTSTSNSVYIQERDLTTQVLAPIPVARESQAVPRPINDIDANRRGVFRAEFSQQPGTINPNLVVQFAGADPKEYVVTHKIGGGHMGEGMGCFIDQPYAYPVDDLNGVVNFSGFRRILLSSVQYSVTTPVGSGTVTTTLTLTAGDIVELNGCRYHVAGANKNTNEMFLVEDLASPVAALGGSTTQVNIFDGSPIYLRKPDNSAYVMSSSDASATRVSFTVNQPNAHVYQSPIVVIGGGSGRFHPGDVITFTGFAETYLVTEVENPVHWGGLHANGAKGFVLFVTPFQGPYGGVGLENAIRDGVSVISTFPTTFTATGSMQSTPILMPSIADHVEFAITPVDDNVVQGSRTVTMTLVGSLDYFLQGTQTNTVTIADDDAIASIVKIADASRPDTAGTMRIQFTGANGQPAVFPKDVAVQFSLADGPGTVGYLPTPADPLPTNLGSVLNPDYTPYDYIRPTTTITLPHGQSGIDIPFIPLAVGGAYKQPRSVTATLSGSYDFAFQGAGGGLANPSASLNIIDTQGFVTVSAFKSPAKESVTSPDPGIFRIALTRKVGSSGAVGAAFSVASGTGQPVYGTDYTLTDTQGNLLVVQVTPTAILGSVPLSTTVNDMADINVLPLNNGVAEGDLIVSMRIIRGQGYTFDPNPASVVIKDAQPTVTVSAVSPQVNEGDKMHFILSYTGDTLTSNLTVQFTLGQGIGDSAVAGTDYTDIPHQAIILAGQTGGVNNTATVTIQTLYDGQTSSSKQLSLIIQPTSGTQTYTVSSTDRAAVAILDEEPTISVSVGQVAAEPSTDGKFTISLNKPSPIPLTLAYVVTGAPTSAIARVAVPTPQSVTLPALQTSIQVTLPIIDDAVYSPNQTITLTMLPSATRDYVVGTLSSATMILGDDEQGITNVTSSNIEGTYRLSDTIDLQVTFSSVVTVTGTPRILLNSGTTAYANYVSGSGTSTLVFRYTVGAGDATGNLDYSTTAALSANLNGGTISGPGNLTLLLPSPGTAGSLSANRRYVINGSSVAGATMVAVRSVVGYEVAMAPNAAASPSYPGTSAKLRFQRYDATSGIVQTAGTTTVQFTFAGTAVYNTDFLVTATSYPSLLPAIFTANGVAGGTVQIPNTEQGVDLAIIPLYHAASTGDLLLATSLTTNGNTYAVDPGNPAVTTPIGKWAQSSFDQVAVVASNEIAVEPDNNGQGGVSGQFRISRLPGSSGTILAYLRIANDTGLVMATYGSDYTISGASVVSVQRPDAVGYPTFYDMVLVTIPDGTSSVLVNVDPLYNGAIKGRTAMTLRLLGVPGRYNANGSTGATVSIQERDLKVQVQARVPIAYESHAVPLPLMDPDLNRRGVFSVQFSQLPGVINPNVVVQFAGADPKQYVVTHKIGGGRMGEGLGWVVDQPYAYPAKDLNGIPGFSGYRQLNLNSVQYTVTTLLGTQTVTTTLTLELNDILEINGARYHVDAANHTTNVVYLREDLANPYSGVQTNLVDGLSVLLRNKADTAYVYSSSSVDHTWVGFTIAQSNAHQAQSPLVVVSGGTGNFYPGDVITFGAFKEHYLVTGVQNPAYWDASAHTNSRGLVVFIQPFQGPYGGSGLEADLANAAQVVSTFATTLTSAAGSLQSDPILIPSRSSLIEFGITPVDDTAVQGSRQVNMTLVGSLDYYLQGTQTNSVTIADDDAVVNITKISDANRPDSAGTMRISFTGANGLPVTFPKDVPVGFGLMNGPQTVGYQPTPVNPVPAVQPQDTYDYIIPAMTMTMPQGQSSVDVPIIPLASVSYKSPRTVIATLNGSYDFVFQGTGSGSANPSASVNIVDTQGTVSVAATTPTAQESASVPVPGAFTFTMARKAGSVGAVGANFSVSAGDGWPLYNTDYILTDQAGNPLPVTVTPTAILGTVTLAGAGNPTAVVSVQPKNNGVAEGDLMVQMTVVRGQGYTLLPGAATVIIKDAQPGLVLNVAQASVAEGGTAVFTISYVGETLSTDLTVPFTLSGTAVAGTDFNDVPHVVTIQNGKTNGVNNVGTVSFSTIYDGQALGSKTLIMTLTPPVGSHPAYTIGSPSVQTVTITDVEPTITTTLTTNATPSVPGVFTVTLNHASPSPLVLTCSFNGSPTSALALVTIPASVNVPAGQTSVAIPIPILGSAGAFPPGQTITFSLQSGSGYVVGTPSSAVMTLTSSPNGVVAVTSVSPDGTYLASSAIDLNVKFTTPVTVTGEPRLQLNAGPSAFASYTAGTGTDTLTFHYVVGIGETATVLDYTSTTALTTTGGAAITATGLSLILPTPGSSGSLASHATLVVNGNVTQDGKPMPGVLPVDSSGGGNCGLGSGLAAALLGALLLALRLTLRPRRQV